MLPDREYPELSDDEKIDRDDLEDIDWNAWAKKYGYDEDDYLWDPMWMDKEDKGEMIDPADFDDDDWVDGEDEPETWHYIMFGSNR